MQISLIIRHLKQCECARGIMLIILLPHFSLLLNLFPNEYCSINLMSTSISRLVQLICVTLAVFHVTWRWMDQDGSVFEDDFVYGKQHTQSKLELPKNLGDQTAVEI
eukprot:1099299_1